MATWMSLMLSAPNIPLDRRLPSNEIGQIARQNERAVEIYNKPRLRPKPMEGLEVTATGFSAQDIDKRALEELHLDWQTSADNSTVLVTKDKRPLNGFEVDMVARTSIVIQATSNPDWHVMNTPFMSLGLKALANRLIEGWTTFDIKEFSDETDGNNHLHPEIHGNEVRGGDDDSKSTSSSNEFVNQYLNRQPWASEVRPEFAAGEPRTSTGAFRNQQSRPNRPIAASRSVPAGARPPLPDDLASFYSNTSSSPRPVEGRRIFPYRPTQVPELSQNAYANPPPQHYHSFASLYDEAPRNPVLERHPLPPWDRGTRSASHPLGHVHPDHIDEPGSVPLFRRGQRTLGLVSSEDETERRMWVYKEPERSVPKRGPGTRPHRQKRTSAGLTPRKARSHNELKAEQGTTAPIPHVTFVSKSKSASQGSDRFRRSGSSQPAILNRWIYQSMTPLKSTTEHSDDLAPDQGYDSGDVADDDAGEFGQAGQRGTIGQVELFEVESVDSRLRELDSISVPAKKSNVEEPHQLTELMVEGPVQGPLPSNSTTDNDCPSSTPDTAHGFEVHPKEASTGQQDGREIKTLSLRRPMLPPTSQKPTTRARAASRLTAQIEESNVNPNTSDSEESMSTFEPQLPPVMDAPAPEHESPVPVSTAWRGVVFPVRPHLVPIYVRGNELGQTWYAGPERVWHLRQVHVSWQLRGRSAMPVPHMKTSPPPPARFFSQLELNKPIKRLTGAGDWETPEAQEKGGGIVQWVWNAVRSSFDLVCTVVRSIS
ncbi:predicted protein [Verticillium alfalfae VaMs.102]|uniref:Predicted protein n=1 Tax=Verticillium alfalfae (strain VaMs.102 / ATCC MYA-4576 / FGSC 10136) TaxID=526221 RepID=C9S7X6_VERA1|nr:predicted protein [Verticillium alfalfae VaMs.102]EEY14861.1 predicted protein [Verticillium alfalfae VaMs.102]